MSRFSEELELRLMCPTHSKPGREIVDKVISRKDGSYTLLCGTIRGTVLPVTAKEK